MNNTVRGEVHFVDETKTFGEKGFQKRLLVLTQPDGKFQQFIPVEFIREDCAAADTLNVGDEVEVDYRLTGRRWQKDPSSEIKYFLGAEVQSFRVVSSDPPAAPAPAASPENLPF